MALCCEEGFGAVVVDAVEDGMMRGARLLGDISCLGIGDTVAWPIALVM